MSIGHDPYQIGNCKIACDFGAYRAIKMLMAIPRQRNEKIAYQANLCRIHPDPEELKRAWKNLNRLSEMHNIPASLLDHQRALIASMETNEWLIDEYLGVSDSSLLLVLRESLKDLFAKRFLRQRYPGPHIVEDTSDDSNGFLETGIHSFCSSGSDAFTRASAAISREDVLSLLTWPPTCSRVKPVCKIFISYRREDSRHITGRIFDRLVQHFHADRVFMDVRGIPLGQDFREVLEREVNSADVLLAVIGPHWAVNAAGVKRLYEDRDFVRREIEIALQKTTIVPLLVDGAAIPDPADLPPSLRPMAFRNGMQVRPDPDFDVDLDRLIRHLNGLSGDVGG
jgi:hypothetical protein